MGKRQENLVTLLKTQTNRVNCDIVLKPKLKDYQQSEYYTDLMNIYEKLNGLKHEIPTRIGPYDCIVENSIVELDEENHFNLYRAITLQAKIYKKSPIKKNYLKYCDKYQRNCRIDLGYWNTDSSDKLFGESDINGTLGVKGSSRWKQRAFYDLLKDHIPFILNIPIKRISIYDTIILGSNKYLIDDILKSSDKKFAEPIYKTIFS